MAFFGYMPKNGIESFIYSHNCPYDLGMLTILSPGFLLILFLIEPLSKPVSRYRVICLGWHAFPYTLSLLVNGNRQLFYYKYKLHSSRHSILCVVSDGQAVPELERQ